jgi:hypothetical protein
MQWNKILLLVANYKTTGYDFYDSAFPPLALEYIAAYVEDLGEVRIIRKNCKIIWGNNSYRRVASNFSS